MEQGQTSDAVKNCLRKISFHVAADKISGATKEGTMFVERYAASLHSSDLRDDEHHHSTDALIAAALADKSGSGAMLGSLLARVKFADGTKSNPARATHLAQDVERARARGREQNLSANDIHRLVAEVHKTYLIADTGLDQNLAQALRLWSAVVTEKGKARGWMKPKTPWDIEAAHKLYEKVAHASLAHWLHGHCEPCGGTGNTIHRRLCECCKGTGKAEVQGEHLEANLIRDLVSELEGLFQAHSGRATAMLRRVA